MTQLEILRLAYDGALAKRSKAFESMKKANPDAAAVKDIAKRSFLYN